MNNNICGEQMSTMQMRHCAMHYLPHRTEKHSLSRKLGSSFSSSDATLLVNSLGLIKQQFPAAMMPTSGLICRNECSSSAQVTVFQSEIELLQWAPRGSWKGPRGDKLRRVRADTLRLQVPLWLAKVCRWAPSKKLCYPGHFWYRSQQSLSQVLVLQIHTYEVWGSFKH